MMEKTMMVRRTQTRAASLGWRKRVQVERATAVIMIGKPTYFAVVVAIKAEHAINTASTIGQLGRGSAAEARPAPRPSPGVPGEGGMTVAAVMEVTTPPIP